MITTVIGAFPKPNYLNIPDWFRAKGGTDTQHPTKGYLEAINKMGDDAEKIILRATKEIIEDQIECGIDIITDGEVRRENYIHYHCRHIKGIDFNKLTKKIARTGNYECFLPTITNKVEAKKPFLANEWIQTQKLSSKPVKITLPGPMTITDTIANEYYDSNEKLGFDLAKVINVEVKKLVKEGCEYIQIDEPLFARKPEEAINYGITNLEKCFEGLNHLKVEKITHICCGYPDRLDAINYPKAPLDSYEKISKMLDNSIVDTISIEDAHRYNNLKLLKNFKEKKIIIGLVKIASSVCETTEEIKKRLHEALNFIDSDRLIAAPDCGLGHLSRDLAKKKLKTMVKAVKEFN